jgi:hypothetical protein
VLDRTDADATRIATTVTVDSPIAPARRGSPLLRTRLGVAAILIAIFISSVVMRAPWRGHLAPGDQWVTALALRWLSTWHREGAVQLDFALVESPPTAAFAGERRVVKWGLPGHMLLVHGLLAPFGLAPTVERLHRINLGLHFLLAATLSVVAGLLAARASPGLRRLAPLIALHAGAFTLWFPPLLYWGQNLSIQDFTVLPLLVFIVAARWLRNGIERPARRATLDAAVALAVFCGTMTEFLFLVVPPYLIVGRLLAARRGRAHPSDPWFWTLAAPFAAGLGCLAWIFAAQGQFALLGWRARTWMFTGAEQTGLLISLVLRAWFFLKFFAGHFLDAYVLIGALALILAVGLLRGHPRFAALPAAVRGILLDLCLPCVLLTLLLAQHQAVHSVSAIKYVPFVTLFWTVLTPWLLEGTSPAWRGRLTAAYCAGAALSILPFSSNYRSCFPQPAVAWDAEAAFLRRHTAPTDTVASTVIEVDINPPERIALVERQVTHVYGPLDLLTATATLPAADLIALYGPTTTFAAFGATAADVTTQGDYALARFPVARLRALLAERPDARLRALRADILRGELRPTGDPLRPHAGVVLPPPLPLAMHTTDASGMTERLYWADGIHMHWRAGARRGRGRESLVLGENIYETDWMGRWRPASAFEPTALAWGRFIRALYGQAEATGRGGTAWHFPWHGYDVLSLPVFDPPAGLRARAPSVPAWQAYLLFDAGAPVGAALGPSTGGPGWICVVYDALAAPIALPGYVSPDWTVRSGTR